jgi:hypothetical protein
MGLAFQCRSNAVDTFDYFIDSGYELFELTALAVHREGIRLLGKVVAESIRNLPPELLVEMKIRHQCALDIL